jgi:hypothetical protein
VHVAYITLRVVFSDGSLRIAWKFGNMIDYGIMNPCPWRFYRYWIAVLRRGVDKSLAFPFLFAAQPREIFLDGLKKLEQRSQKCVELRGNM